MQKVILREMNKFIQKKGKGQNKKTSDASKAMFKAGAQVQSVVQKG
jgi:hypothetical protein